MHLANQGDSDTYRRLLEEVGDVIERYLRRRFGDSDFVEDCVQDCLLAIHRARESYDPLRSFRSWLFAIVRHKAIDHLRRRGTRERYEVTEETSSAEPAAATPEPTSALRAAELLDGLEPKYRDALILTKLHGYSLADAAARAGVSPTAMKSRVHRAIRQVRARLEREEGP
jgi:RNA polymerase sigma-70 factor (ECF subfamily)